MENALARTSESLSGMATVMNDACGSTPMNKCAYVRLLWSRHVQVLTMTLQHFNHDYFHIVMK
eukprot:851408-Amphidinium_carterae.1